MRAHVAAAVGTFGADCLSCLEDGCVLDRRGGGLGGMRDNDDKGQESKDRQEGGANETLHVAVGKVCV